MAAQLEAPESGELCVHQLGGGAQLRDHLRLLVQLLEGVQGDAREERRRRCAEAVAEAGQPLVVDDVRGADAEAANRADGRLQCADDQVDLLELWAMT